MSNIVCEGVMPVCGGRYTATSQKNCKASTWMAYVVSWLKGDG